MLTRRTKRLVVRPFRAGDYSAWRSAYLEAPVKRNRWDQGAREAAALTRPAFSKLLKARAAKLKKDWYYDFALFRKTDGAMVGGVSLMEVARGVSHTCFLGYWVLNQHWGNGYAREAVAAALDIAFKDLKLHRVEAGIEPENDRSITLAKRLGFRYEGKKKRCLFLRGKWVDLLIYTVTTEDLGLKFRGPTPKPTSR